MSEQPPSPSGFDPERIVRALDAAGVRYVLVGGVAARLHGSPTLTEDVDVTPETSAANLARLADALRSLDARLAAPGVDEGLPVPLDERTFNSPVMKFVTAAGEIDVVLEPLGVGGYETLSRQAVTFEVFGIRIAAAALEDIIASKAASDRPKDRLQLAILRDVRRETGGRLTDS